MRICIVADNASARFGGEAVLPLHYFRQLRQRDVEVWLVVHDRCRAELESLLPEEQERMRFVPDTAFHRVLFRFSGLLPRRVAESTVGLLMLMFTQWTQRSMVWRLIREHGIDVLHQPAPVAPSYPSMFFGLGRPLIIGPMNGGMDYPPAFAPLNRSRAESLSGWRGHLPQWPTGCFRESETPPCCWWPIRGQPPPCPRDAAAVSWSWSRMALTLRPGMRAAHRRQKIQTASSSWAGWWTGRRCRLCLRQ